MSAGTKTGECCGFQACRCVDVCVFNVLRVSSMAAGVEDAAVICTFMTPAYQASRSCKKELNYADSREVIIVPVMLANDWEASEWLGLITAGLLWVDFRYRLLVQISMNSGLSFKMYPPLHILSRNAEEDEQCFQMCLQSLVEEITFNAGHLLTVEEPQRELVDQSEPPKLPLKKPGRGFCHALTKLYINEAGRQTQWFFLQVQFGRCSKKISQKWTCLSLVKPLETNPRTLTHQTEINQPPHFSCAE